TVLLSAETRVLPSGENASDAIDPEWPLRGARSFQVATSHRLILPSELLVARVLPSGLNTAHKKGLPISPLKVARSWPVAVSYSTTATSILPILSSLRQARVWLSGENGMGPKWVNPGSPLRVANTRPVATSHSFDFPFADVGHVTSVRPSGAKAT